MKPGDPMPRDPHQSAGAPVASSRSREAPPGWGPCVAAGRELARWFESPAGRYVLDWEQAQFDERVADIFGFHAVQLGFAQIDALRANRMPAKLHAAEWMPDPGTDGASAGAPCQAATVLTQFEDLPFAAQSIDLIVLPHALELSPDPHHLLREAERVLVPEGKLIVSCFNPYSLWGARQFVGRVIGVPFMPRAGQFISLPRVKDWLKLLDFAVEGGKFGCYRPACRAQAWLDRTRLLDAAGDRWWPVFGAVYVLQAVKRVHGMRLIGPAWRTRSQRAASLAPAAQRGSERATAERAESIETAETCS